MKLHKRVAYIFSSAILSMSSMLVLIAPVAKAAADTCTWTGTGGDALMSNAGNWSGCDNGTIPESGDSLVIPSTATAFALNNDLVGYSFVNITANGALDNGTCNTKNVAITGNDFTLTGSIILNHTGICSNGYSIDIDSNLAISGSSSQYVDASSSTVFESAYLNGTVTGSNSLIARGSFLNIADNVSQSVTLGVDGGGEIYNAVADCTNKVISNNVSIADDARLTVSTGATDCNFTITNLSLSSNATLDARNVTVTTTNFNDNGYTYKVTDGSLTKWVVDGQTLEGAYVETIVNTDQTGTSFSTNGKEKIIVNAGGITGAVNVLQYGYLMGNGGTVGAVNVATGGFLAPGNSPGCLASGALSIAGTYEVEVQGADPCTGYDQMNVTGGVTLTGGTLSVSTSNFAPKAGDKFTIINNITAGPVTSTFTGLAEGAEVVTTGVTYTISYVGGDGNDVVLTVKTVDASAIPGAPNTGVAMLTSNPLLTTIVTLMMVAGLVIVSRKQNQTN